MEQSPEANELDLIQVIDGEDDFVQILGVTPDEDGGEIEVTAVEFDEGESFFIDVDDDPLLDMQDHQELIDINEDLSSDDSIDAGDNSEAADMI